MRSLIFSYNGKIKVRPMGRGICLEDYSTEAYLEEEIPEGEWAATIEVLSHGTNVYTLDDAIADLYGVQLIDNTSDEADIARKGIEAIFRKLVAASQ